jgi:hypothetical protein
MCQPLIIYLFIYGLLNDAMCSQNTYYRMILWLVNNSQKSCEDYWSQHAPEWPEQTTKYEYLRQVHWCLSQDLKCGISEYKSEAGWANFITQQFISYKLSQRTSTLSPLFGECRISVMDLLTKHLHRWCVKVLSASAFRIEAKTLEKVCVVNNSDMRLYLLYTNQFYDT